MKFHVAAYNGQSMQCIFLVFFQLKYKILSYYVKLGSIADYSDLAYFSKQDPELDYFQNSGIYDNEQSWTVSIEWTHSCLKTFRAQIFLE
jgi:hypothetical protein